MSNKVKDIDIKNQPYYFFNDIINIDKFDQNNIKISENSYENILIYQNNDSKHVKRNSVNPTLFLAKKMDTLKKLINISISR